jgi:DNA-3-methyladenine glycosylase II
MRTAETHLARADPLMRRLIDRVGPSRLQVDRRHTPYQSLVRAVAYQQLHARAAETILGRFHALFPGTAFPSPEQVLAVDAGALRAVGFSRAKTLAIRDIAAKTLEGVVAGRRVLARLNDDDLIERLVQVRGVGRWTVQMFLIFTLGRPDVLPADDYGVRNGFRIAKKLADLPTRKELIAHGERWRPFRSTAAWYLWRATELKAR